MTDTPRIRFSGHTDAWEQRKLGNLMNITSVKRIHQSDWTDNGVRFLRARDIVAFSKHEEVDDQLYISQDKYDEFSKISGKVQVGDLLVTGVGTIGVPYLIENTKPLYFKDGNIIWFQNNNKIDGKFFLHSFNGKQIQSFIKDSAGTGTVGTYTIDSGKKTPILLPSLEEQTKIGNYFSLLDTAITLHQRKSDEMKELKKYMLQKMFPKPNATVPEIRFAGYTDAWEQRKLEKIGEHYSTGTLGYADLDVNGTNKCVLYGELYTKYNERIVNADSRTNKNGTIAKKNDILFPTSTTVDAMSLIAPSCVNDDEIIAGGDLFGIRPNKDIDGNFVSYYVNGNDKVKTSLAKKAQGLTIVHLHYDAIKEEVLSIPCLEEQQKISAYFSRLDHAITLHQRKSDEFRELKKYMLQQMFPKK